MRHFRQVPAALLAALVLLFIVAAPHPVAAQSTIRIVGDSAEPAFPERVTFTLEAQSSAGMIESVQLLYGEQRSEALTIVDLPVTPAETVRVEHVLDTRVYYSPPGTAIVYRWVLRDSAGAVFESEPQSFVFHDERFNWRERNERNITVLWYRGDDAFGDELLQTSLRTLDRLEREIGATLNQPVRIYIYASISDMRSALQSNEVEWVGGQAWPGLGVIVAAIEPGDTDEVRRIVPHELSHQVLHQAIENPYGGAPVWFDEGLAVHNQETRDVYYDTMIRDAATSGRLIPLEALSSSFPADPDQATLSYAQSRDVVEYIIATYGETALQNLVADFAGALPVEEALTRTLGRTVDELDAEWRATLPVAVVQPTPVPAQMSAPPDRFSEPPVAPNGGTIPLVPPAADAESWLAGLPNWTLPVLAASFCMAGTLLVGVALLVGLRLVGVDKRPN
jgi:hypothetical protein